MKRIVKLKRKLTPRELRRLKVHKLLPADSVDSKMYASELKRKGLKTYDKLCEDDIIECDSRKSLKGKKASFVQQIFQSLGAPRNSKENCVSECSSDEYHDVCRKEVFEGKLPLSREPENLRANLLLPPEIPTKVLLVSTKRDATIKGISKAFNSFSFELISTRSFDTAIEICDNFWTNQFQLVIVDTRDNLEESLNFGKFLVSLEEQNSILVGITENKQLVSEIPVTLSLLDIGYNSCIGENENPSFWSSEMRKIYRSLIKFRNEISLQKILYKILGKIDDAVLVTDLQFKVQYLNKSMEKLMNQKPQQLIGECLDDLVCSDFEEFQKKISRNKQFEGKFQFKSEDPLSVHVKAFPGMTGFNQKSHIILICSPTIQEESSESLVKLDRPVSLESLLMPWEKMRNSGSIKKSEVFENFDVSSKVKILLENWYNWDFEIFGLEAFSNRNPLVHLGELNF